VRVDGGQSMNAFTDMAPGSFQVELAGAFATTLANPIKFNRFARRVLGPESSWSARVTLWGDVLSTFRDLVKASRGALSSHWYPTQEGFGRTDALARIANTVFGDHVDPANYRTGNGPVSYPYMWNIWKFDWVQYNASVSQPMARNVGEAVGTGATYSLLDRYGRPIPASDRYRTSIPIENLQRIENTIQTLEPPAWPEDLLGRIDQAKVARGRQLFNEHCAGCHGPHPASELLTRAISPARGPADPLWQIRWKALDDIGTDPNAAVNFMKNRVDLTRTGLDPGDVQRLLREPLEQERTRQLALVASVEKAVAARRAGGEPDYLAEELSYAKKAVRSAEDQLAGLDQIDLRSVSIGEGLTIVGTLIRNRYYDDHRYSVEARACFDGFDTLDLPQAVPGYKPRPLKGVWATPPFLHNGSVPTVYALLSPREDRPATFYVGTHLYNQRDLGYVTERSDGARGGFMLDTALPGNRNTGHEFRKGYVPFDESKPPETQYQGGVIGPELTKDERYAIIEYLKVGPDEPPTPPGRVPPDCFALLHAKPAAVSPVVSASNDTRH
jgi:mono/diheme cytochrome c family protein